MIHIVKAKGGFMNITLGKKREVLAASELLKTKQNAFKNAIAQSYFFSPFNIPRHDIFIQDDTDKEPVCFMLSMDGKKLIKTIVDNQTVEEYFSIKIKKYIKK